MLNQPCGQQQHHFRNRRLFGRVPRDAGEKAHVLIAEDWDVSCGVVDSPNGSVQLKLAAGGELQTYLVSVEDNFHTQANARFRSFGASPTSLACGPSAVVGLRNCQVPDDGLTCIIARLPGHVPCLQGLERIKTAATEVRFRTCSLPHRQSRGWGIEVRILRRSTPRTEGPRPLSLTFSCRSWEPGSIR